jgi:ATP-dependent Lon protease
MGVLIFTARVHDLIYQKSNIEYRLTKLTKKLRDLQQYSAAISNGGVSIGDLLNAPGSMLGRTMNYLGFAHNNALQYMQQNAPYMQTMYMQQIGSSQSAEQQQQMNQYIMRQLYQQGRDLALQQETKNLKLEEDRLTQEKEKLETLGKEIEADLKSAKEARDKGIQDMAPKYTFNA